MERFGSNPLKAKEQHFSLSYRFMQDKNNNIEIAVLGGGCFWCTEAVFQELRGVISATSGYAGGSQQAPTYEDVSRGTTGHAEVIKIEFDPGVISYRALLEIFFAT